MCDSGYPESRANDWRQSLYLATAVRPTKTDIHSSTQIGIGSFPHGETPNAYFNFSLAYFCGASS